MATAPLGTLLQHVRTLTAGAETDRQLLDDFAVRHDEAAFTALVARHGPMVLRVCRCVLGHEQDAEDAFQATFLVLAHNTRSIQKREAVGDWLHGVAYRTAMKAKRGAARRRNHEARLADRRTECKSVPPTWDDVQAVLDEEVQRLPTAFRSAFVLCVMEGKSVAEAAAELGIREGTVKSRVNRARECLQRRFARRGIELAAILAALSVAQDCFAAAVPAALAKDTIRFGLVVAGGKSAAGVISTHIAAMAAGVTRATLVTKTQVAVAVLLAATISIACGLACILAGSDDAKAAQHKPVEPPANLKQQSAKDKESITCSGRVVDPDGNPVHRAKLLFLEPYEQSLPNKIWAISGADGRFQFTVSRLRLANRRWGLGQEVSQILAVAQGYGFAVARLKKPEEAAELKLRLVKDDVPIRGRIFNLEGKPMAGVRVSINDFDPLNAAPLYTPKKGDLATWIAALRAKDRDAWDMERAYFTELYCRLPNMVAPPVKTDQDGRFELRGIGRERLVHLRIEGATIATQIVNAMTRASGKITVPLSAQNPRTGSITYHGAGFEILAEPTKPVVGIVRDKDTGKPLAGVTVTPSKIANPFGISNYNAELVRTTTDKAGRYRLVGLPKGKDNQLLATTEALPYVPAVQKVENTTGLEPVTVDFALKRGVWIQGRVTEKITGTPLLGSVGYYCFNDNPNSKLLPRLFASNSTSGRTREDGSFRIVGLPGRGLVAVQVLHNNRYLPSVGADKIKVPRLNLGMQYFDTSPSYLQIASVSTIVEITPKPGDESIRCDLVVVPGVPGRTLTGTVLGPDNQPLTDVDVAGAQVDCVNFTVEDLKPEERRLIQFRHEEKKLAGFLIVQGNDKGPLQVRLEPWGTLTGRILAAEDQPLEGIVRLRCLGRQPKNEPKVYEFEMISPLDAKGRFRIERLTSGLTYELGVGKQGHAVDIVGGKSKDLTIEPGQTRDLGNIQVRVKE